MENLIIYILKASGLLAVFILAYFAFLRKETFFNSNRWYLLAGLVTSAVLPLLVYTRIIWIDPAPLQHYNSMELHRLVMLQHAQVAEPEFSINGFDFLAALYLTGVLFFFLRFVMDILSIRRIIKGQPIVKHGKYLLVDSPDIKSPFSFFNYIVYNSASLQPEELESIISHEKVHSSQKHSLDMIIGQLYCIAFWFNPFAWMYKNSISQNLEFIADAEATKIIADKKAYQKILLKITVQPQCIAITNHFYQSLIKKRIVMLNKQQSKKRNSWKYAIVLPVLAAFMLLFQVRTVAQEKEGVKKIIPEKAKVTIEVTKDSKDEELESDKKVFKDEFDTDVNFENIKRNQNNEITAIKVVVKDAGQSQVYEVAGDSPISPFTIEVEKDDSGRNNIMFGNGNSSYQVTADNFFRTEGLKDGGNDSIKTRRHIIRSYGQGDLPPAARIPIAPPAPEFGWSNNMQIQSNDMLVVIDGVSKGKGDAAIRKLDQNSIASINIIKGKEAKKKYGKEAKEGVIEIITRKPGSRMTMIAPNRYHIEIPDLPHGEAFGFNFDFPNLPDMEGMERMENFEKAFEQFKFEDFNKFGEMLSPEDIERLQKDLSKTQEEMQRMLPEMQNRLHIERRNMSDEEFKEARKEIEEARSESKKEIEKVKKELQEVRKELEQTRKSFNKKA